jgi:hypothetical protein
MMPNVEHERRDDEPVALGVALLRDACETVREALVADHYGPDPVRRAVARAGEQHLAEVERAVAALARVLGGGS